MRPFRGGACCVEGIVELGGMRSLNLYLSGRDLSARMFGIFRVSDILPVKKKIVFFSSLFLIFYIVNPKPSISSIY